MKTTLLFLCSLFCLPRRVLVFVPFYSRGNDWYQPPSDWSTGSLWPTSIGSEWSPSSSTSMGGNFWNSQSSDRSIGNFWNSQSSDGSIGSLLPTSSGSEWPPSSSTGMGGNFLDSPSSDRSTGNVLDSSFSDCSQAHGFLGEESRSLHSEVCDHCHMLERKYGHGCGDRCNKFQTCRELQKCSSRLTGSHWHRHHDFPDHLVCSFCKCVARRDGHPEPERVCSLYCTKKFLNRGRLLTL
ncbi:uncharacterized protein LOC133173126 isoform X3 [Saccostrea echinata]|uniref:uncharacterized protein LOC133173126 isoform X3 n=1 Tax=Saccostrea echinata TaxID=191078 RepID=UPI002A8031F1|nr:uncharacterized protein LOC133173126 isoform X3 [Saccostrea echinata]